MATPPTVGMGLFAIAIATKVEYREAMGTVVRQRLQVFSQTTYHNIETTPYTIQSVVVAPVVACNVSRVFAVAATLIC